MLSLTDHSAHLPRAVHSAESEAWGNGMSMIDKENTVALAAMIVITVVGGLSNAGCGQRGAQRPVLDDDFGIVATEGHADGEPVRQGRLV